MRPAWLRSLPALAVLALFALGAQAPRAARAPITPMMGLPPVAACEQLAEESTGDSLYAFPVGASLVQPFEANVPLAACSLAVSAVGWASMRLVVQDWDPVTLLPDAYAIAQRIVDLNPSALQYYTRNSAPRVGISPPIIARSLPGVADPPRTSVALQMLGAYTIGGYFRGHFAFEGPEAMPTARFIQSGVSSPLPGAHPVIAHSLCSATGDADQARVAQAVTSVDGLLPRTDEWLQYFRVPSTVDLCWVELAILSYDPAMSSNINGRVVQILDVTGHAQPGADLPESATRSLFKSDFWTVDGARQPIWTTANSFDHGMRLEPGHVYALRISNVRTHEHYARTLTGTESSTFQYGVGKLYARDSTSADWIEAPGRSLAFKLIAIPVAATVGVAPPAAPAFALHVSPNPSHGVAEVTWSGAVGPVSLDVLDARGRRVATGNGGAAGHWQWTAKRSGGNLPAGVYFVRARDSEGGVVTERLVVIR